MPHLIIEYSSNLREHIAPEAFVEHVHAFAEDSGEYPPRSVRTRTEERTEYRVGDGSPANGFIHIVLRVRPGRDHAQKRKLTDDMYGAGRAYLDPLLNGRPVLLSFEVQDIDAEFRFLRNYWAADA